MSRTFPHRISLRLLLTVPFAIQMGVGIGVTAWMAYRQEQRSIENFLNLHFVEIQGLVIQELDRYLQRAPSVNQSHLAALRAGVISLDRPEQLHAYLIAQHQLLSDVTTLMVGTETGIFRTIHWTQIPGQPTGSNVRSDEQQRQAGRSHPQDPSQLDLYALDDQGNPSRYLETLQKIDVRDRPWYQAAIASGRPGWSGPFRLGNSGLLTLNAYAPIYRRDTQPRAATGLATGSATNPQNDDIVGVFAANLALDYLDNFLATLHVVRQHQGVVFLMEAETGLLIANSSGIPSYEATITDFAAEMGEQSDWPTMKGSERIQASASDLPLLRATAQRVMEMGHAGRVPDDQPLFQNIKVEDQIYYFQSLPYQRDSNLSWVLVTVLPKASILEDFQTGLFDRLGILGLTLAGVVIIGLWLTRRLSRSLSYLTQASQDLAHGNLTVPFPKSHIQELEDLAEVFQQIVLEKEQVQDHREQYTRKLEARFASQTRILEEAQHIAQVGSWEWDLRTQEIRWSAELYRIYGANPEHPVPQPHVTIHRVHPEDEEHFRRSVVEAALACQAFDVDLRIITQQEEIRYVQMKGRPVTDEKGEIHEMMGIVANITDRKLMELELQSSMAAADAATQAKSDFLATMSHEIRTPLNGILGMLTLLQTSALNPEQQTHAKLAQSSAESLLLLINDILDFSKVDAGKLELETIDFCVYEQLWEMLQSLTLAAAQKNLTLILDLHRIEKPQLQGDPSRIRQIFTNLVGNALKFTQSGEILVQGCLETQDQQVLFHGRVQDTGCGIEPEVLQNLFKPFTQGDASTSRQYGGTGLGLAICKRLCKLMGGNIWVTSTVGVGTCFEFTVALGAASPCFIEQSPLTFPLQFLGLSVLVVETNASQRQALRRQLEAWGVTVTACGSGMQALQRLEAWDLALVDGQVADRDRLLQALQRGVAVADNTPTFTVPQAVHAPETSQHPNPTPPASPAIAAISDSKPPDTAISDPKPPDIAVLDFSTSETAISDSKPPDTTTLDPKSPETAISDLSNSETAISGTKPPDTAASDSKSLETETSDTETLDTETLDTETSDTKPPDFQASDTAKTDLTAPYAQPEAINPAESRFYSFNSQSKAETTPKPRPTALTPIPWVLLTPLHQANPSLPPGLTAAAPPILKPINPVDLARVLLNSVPTDNRGNPDLAPTAPLTAPSPAGSGASSQSSPIAALPPNSAAPTPLASVTPASSSRSPRTYTWPPDVRILLAEDNPVNQMVVKGLMKRMDLTVEVAMQGQEALELLRAAEPEAPYTLVLMDCQMPRLDGYEASRRIREGEAGDRYRQVPIVAMTAHAMKGDREKCLAAGMDDYLSKPIRFETLVQMLEKWILVP